MKIIIMILILGLMSSTIAHAKGWGSHHKGYGKSKARGFSFYDGKHIFD